MSGTAFGPDLTLTRSQEGLLRTALSSNSTRDNASQSPYTAMPSNSRSYTNPKQLDTGSITNGPNMYTSPTQQTPGSGQLDSFDESPFLDYENLDDGNFDWDNSGDQLFGDLPGNEYNEEGELHDKRKASADEEDEEEGSSKRREGDDKSAKKSGQKPGRKPLTGEPTTVCPKGPSHLVLPILTISSTETQGAKQSCSESISRTQRTSSEGSRDQGG